MTKIFPLIHLNSQVYMVDKEAEINKNNWFYNYAGKAIGKLTSPSAFVQNGADEVSWKIITSTDESLGLPLLPSYIVPIYGLKYSEKAQYIYEYSRDDYRWFRSETGRLVREDLILADPDHFIIDPAKAKQYTEEDMYKAMNFAINTRDKNKKIFPTLDWPESEEDTRIAIEEVGKRKEIVNEQIKKFFQSFKPLPTQVEVEMEPWPKGDGWIHLPKEVNNIVQVKRWIWK